MRLLPAPLQMEICYDLNAVPLYSSLIFRKLPEAFLRRLSVTMTHQFYLPGDIVYNQNQNKTIMICITSGVLELLSDEDDESPMISFAKGTCFGEISLVYNIPDIITKIRNEIQERISDSRRRKQEQNNQNPLSLNIYASKHRKKSAIKCLKEKLRTKYHILTAIYFATTTLLSVGFGDFAPGDQFDMAFIAFLSLYGVLLTGYCVSEFSAVVTHWSRTKTAFLEVIITIDRFMKENNMHPAIKSRIMAFYELQWQYNSGVELTGENWLERTVVPSELRKKVLHQARFKTLTSIRFFQVKNKAFIHTLTENGH
ncbi:unnamed protein product, partial [Brenthis ino]